MSSTPVSIDDLFLAIAEGESGAVGKLAGQLQPYARESLPEALRQSLLDNLSLLVSDRERVLREGDLAALVLRLAQLGLDSMALRDGLAALCRQVFSSYPDPSGLIRALGILDSQTPIHQVAERWDRFASLQEGSYAWHDSYGLGKLVEVDGFSDLYVVQFGQRQSFSLHTCLTLLALVKADSLAAQLLAQPPTAKPPEQANAEFVAAVGNSFTPALSDPWRAVEAILVPRFLAVRNFATWRSKGDEPTRGAAAGAERTWETARSLEELANLLERMTRLEPTEIGIENLRRIYRFTAPRPNFLTVFAETLATLQALARRPDDPIETDRWLERVLAAMPPETVAWSDIHTFSKVSSKLPAKLRHPWFVITHRAKGQEWFLQTLTKLPIKFWVTAEEIIPPGSDEFQTLRRLVYDQVRRGDATADAAVWLWQQGDEALREAFTLPAMVFRILSQPVSGDYIKARKDFYALLMDSSDFQATLMRGGSRDAIASFVRAIKTSAVLQKGEQQSLLVKIVRIFPSARELVEERQEVVAKKPLDRLTSYRSMKERHDELEEIVNKKIPENSAAIAHARSYGDLRENAEYKAAKDNQRYLMARRKELERDLKEVLPTDFTEVVVNETVVPGCTVELTHPSGKVQTFHVLGMWDSQPDRQILSFDTPLGRALVGQKKGTAIELPEGGTATITALRALSEELLQWVKAPE